MKGKKKMKETIVTIIMPPNATSIPNKTWWSNALIATFGNPKWKAIIANDKFALISDIGTFILDTKSFASGMMCDLNTWQTKYKAHFEKIVNAIVQGAQVNDYEIDL